MVERKHSPALGLLVGVVRMEKGGRTSHDGVIPDEERVCGERVECLAEGARYRGREEEERLRRSEGSVG
jgi:hypothetical protein